MADAHNQAFVPREATVSQRSPGLLLLPRDTHGYCHHHLATLPAPWKVVDAAVGVPTQSLAALLPGRVANGHRRRLNGIRSGL
jgi:hypothetical protein